MNQPVLRAALLVFYILLIVGEFNNNEFEETFNENVSADFYADFDNDGEFDFEEEDEEESSESSSKMSHAQCVGSRFQEISISVNESRTLYLGFFTQENLNRIFTPPKA